MKRSTSRILTTHAHDLELVHLVDVLLEVKAQAYLIEGAARASRARGRAPEGPRQRLDIHVVSM
jgi:hypothetical protein